MQKFVLALVVLLAGCAHPAQPMAVHEYDPVAKKVGKVALRLALCPVTFCISEVAFSQPPLRPRALSPGERAVILNGLLQRRAAPPVVVVPEREAPSHCLGQIGPHGVVSGSCY